MQVLIIAPRQGKTVEVAPVVVAPVVTVRAMSPARLALQIRAVAEAVRLSMAAMQTVATVVRVS